MKVRGFSQSVCMYTLPSALTLYLSTYLPDGTTTTLTFLSDKNLQDDALEGM